jgi:hypothetical protein
MYNNARITIYKASFILSTLGKLLQRGSEQNYQDTRRNLLKIKMVVSINVFGNVNKTPMIKSPSFLNKKR